jgi:hypothetical protein
LKSFGLAVFEGGSSLVGRAAEAAGLRLWMERSVKLWSSSRLALTLGRAGKNTQALWGSLLARSRLLSALLGTRRARVLTACWSAFLVVGVSYLWFVSVGMWLRWPDTSAYYDKQAEAFLRGQAHLVEEPSQALLDLPIPTTPKRERPCRIVDASPTATAYL